MSYNFPEMPQDFPVPPEYLDEQDAFPYPEDFSEEEFNAAQKGVVEDDESDATCGFHQNLALKMQDNELVSLGGKLLEEVDDQLKMREEWEAAIETAMKYLGRKVEEPNSDGDSGVQKSVAFDTTLSTALYRTYSIYKRELFPPDGPCRSQIIGVPTKEIEEMAERRQMFANYALTVEDRGYYPDSDALVYNTIFTGSAFRKVYQDPITMKPKARFIKSQDFIADLNCTSILSSSSLGFRYFESKREIQQRMKSGNLVKFQLATPSDSDTERSQIDKTALEEQGINIDAMDNKSLYEIHERHVYLSKDDLKGHDSMFKEDDDMLPYIVTIVDKRAVEIKRNWKEDDENRERAEEFVGYIFLPGFGLYGVGMAHLVGSNAITATTMLRQLIQKGQLNLFPGGLKTTTLRSEDNVRNPDAGSWVEVETGGQPLAECFQAMPYPPADPIFLDLYKNVTEGMLSLLGVTETSIPENSAQTPVGTTLSALEVANRLQSASLSSFHTSLRFEFELLFDLWAKSLPDEPYPFRVPGYEGAIMRTDFNEKIATVPVSDPNILTSTHRLMNAEGLTKLAANAPEIYNVKAIHRRMLEAMGVENADEIIEPDPEPQAMDAVTEGMLLLQGQPIKVDENQDHAAHNTVHNVQLQQAQADPNMLAANPAFLFQLTMHIQKHSAAALVQEIRQTMDPTAFQGMEVDEYLQDMRIQNQISAMNAEEAMKQMQQAQEAQQQAAEQAALPQKVMMADIEARKEIEELKAKVALIKIEKEEAIATQKVEAEAFSDQLKFESDTAKIEADREMAEEKNEVDLTIEQMKHNNLEQSI